MIGPRFLSGLLPDNAQYYRIKGSLDVWRRRRFLFAFNGYTLERTWPPSAGEPVVNAVIQPGNLQRIYT